MEMQIKTTSRYHLTPISMVFITLPTNFGKDVERERQRGRETEQSLFLVRMKINTAIVKINLEIFQIKNRTTK